MPLDAEEFISLSRLLDQALDLPDGELGQWLDALPEDLQRLRPKLLELLNRYRTPRRDSFLDDGPRLASEDANSNDASPNDRVGPYVLIRELGRGGMGTVWLAIRFDGALRRHVALKLPRVVWDASLARRMARERDIGVQLEHPSIARLYDAGIDILGRPYLAFEFIDGVTIDVWCDMHYLDTNARLLLFVEVARAVAHAHGRLIVHRDIKPSNILVTTDGRVHLLDFGIAKLLDDVASTDTTLTREHGHVLTPRYASPEQLEGGPVAIASDIYSLGVLLHELLTHRNPFEDHLKSSRDLERAVLCGEPDAASSHVPDRRRRADLRGDLDAILGKALKKRPAERYLTADAFADDVERHLRSEIVLARPDSAWYRAKKFVLRHQLGLAMSSVIVVAVAIGGASTLIQARRTMQELRRAQVSAQFAAEILRPPASSGEGAASASTTNFIDRGAKLIRSRFSGQPDLQAQLYGVVSQTYADMGAGALAVDYANLQIEALKAAGISSQGNARPLLLLARALDVDDRDAEAQAAEAARLAGQDTEVQSEALALLSRIQFNNGEFNLARATVRKAEEALAASSKPSVRAWAEVYMVRALLRPQDRMARALWQRSADAAVRAEGNQSAFAVMVRMDAAQTLMGDGHMDASDTLLNDAQYEVARTFVRDAERAVRNSGGAGEISFAWRNVGWWSMLHQLGRASFKEANSAIERERLFLVERADVVPPVVREKSDFYISQARLSWGDLKGASELLEPSAKALKSSAAAAWPFLRLQVLSTESDIAMMSGRHREAETLIRAWEPIRIQIGPDKIEDQIAAKVAIAINWDFEGRHAEAVKVLDGIPQSLKFKPFYAVPLAAAMLHAGDPTGALRLLSSVHSAIPNEVDAISLLRGEILCATASKTEGLALLMHAIDKQVEQFSSSSPLLARTRALAGLCAVSAGNPALAKRFAAQARSGLEGIPAVSIYYTNPLRQLEQAIREPKVGYNR